MNRHEALRPFSRDHHVLLAYAQRLGRCAGTPQHAAIVLEFLRFAPSGARNHFDIERAALDVVLTPADLGRLTEIEKNVGVAVTRLQTKGDADSLEACAQALQTHVHWLESTVFESLPARLSTAETEAFGRHVDRILHGRAERCEAPRTPLPRRRAGHREIATDK